MEKKGRKNSEKELKSNRGMVFGSPPRSLTLLLTATLGTSGIWRHGKKKP